MGDLIMCGGDSVSVYVTHKLYKLGISIEVDLMFQNGDWSGLTIRDMLLRPPACWGKATYIRELSEQDLDESQILYSGLFQDLPDLKSSHFTSNQEILKQVIEHRVQGVIQERRDHMERVARDLAEEAQRENQPRCMIL